MTTQQNKPTKLTPMMERYREVKRQHPGSILLFRMGDFYELFYQDAELAAKLLGLTLTSRDKGSANPVPMAGFPYHALDNYLQKLIDSGQRAAICDQVEDPKKAKGLVRREVTRVVTPGTLTDEQLLDPREHNFLACVFTRGQRIGLAWLELSTGRFQMSNLTPEALADELARLQPAECLVAESDALAAELQPQHSDRPTLVTRRPDWCFAQQHCYELLLSHFGTQSLEGFDVDESAAGTTAAGALLEYVQETQKSALNHIARLEQHQRGENLIIDEATRRSLELSRTIRGGSRAGSLLEVMDQTVSSMGARLFADWLSNPLTDEKEINNRLDAVEEFTTQPVLRTEIRDQLDQTYDLQRLTARVATGRSSPRDLGCLSRTLALLPELKLLLSQASSPLIQNLAQHLDLCPDVHADIAEALVDDPPLLTTDGGMIRDGYHTELDQQRDLARGGKAWIAAYQARESERSGISNLKVGFNKVFGYYLEVTAANKDKVPEDYIRKQTLKNQERFITPELKEHEDEVLQSEERAFELERQLFEALRNRIAENTARLQTTASVLANADVLASLAVLATHHGYCRPEMTSEPVFDVREGRHPVLDQLQPSGEFVPNDLRMGGGQGRVQLITGPNMAGKSTYIRQAALISIMA
ncbi:MAG: DNA mismatch repair protein MutS, partial [Planctomycetaceae bacterium]